MLINTDKENRQQQHRTLHQQTDKQNRQQQEQLPHLVKLGVEGVHVLLDGVVVGAVEGAGKGPTPAGAVVLTAGVQQVAVEEESITCTEKRRRKKR